MISLCIGITKLCGLRYCHLSHMTPFTAMVRIEALPSCPGIENFSCNLKHSYVRLIPLYLFRTGTGVKMSTIQPQPSSGRKILWVAMESNLMNGG
jgi:hypothetical protein